MKKQRDNYFKRLRPIAAAMAAAMLLGPLAPAVHAGPVSVYGTPYNINPGGTGATNIGTGILTGTVTIGSLANTTTLQSLTTNINPDLGVVELSVTPGAVAIRGTTSITGTLSTTDRITAHGITSNHSLIVNDWTFTRDIANTGTVSTSTLSTTGAASVGGLATMGGGITSGTININNLTSGPNNISGVGTLGVTGAASVGGTLGVGGLATMSGGAAVTGTTNINTTGVAATTIGAATNTTNINSGTTNVTGITNINTSGSAGTNIGNAGSITTVVGVTNINTTGTASTSIGNAAGTTSITGSTNTILGTTNINTTGSATTNIATGAAATTNIGMLGGTNNIAGTTNINADVNNATNINTGTSISAVTIGNSANITHLRSATTNIGVSSAYPTSTNIGTNPAFASTNTIGNTNTGTRVHASAGNSAMRMAQGAAYLKAGDTTGGIYIVMAGASSTWASADSNGRITVSTGIATEPTTAMVMTNSLGNTHGIVIHESRTVISGGRTSTSLTLDDSGARFSDSATGAPVKVTGVADGTGDFDAVNVRQLKKAYSGIASVAALAAIPAPAQGKRFSIGVGFGRFEGHNAVAMGIKSAVTNSISFTSGVGFSSERTTMNAGLGFSF